MPRLSTIWLVSGALSLLAGFLAILNPLAATIATLSLAAFGLIMAGVLQAVAAFDEPEWKHRAMPLLLAAATLILAFALLRRPDLGASVVIVTVAAMFLLSGVAKIIWSFLKRDDGFLWPALISGILSVVLAVLLMRDLGGRAMQLLGLLVGLELMLNGMVLLAAGSTTRRIRKEVGERLNAQAS